MRIAFAGSPEAAVPVLAALAESRHEIALVITQPPKPRGRGKEPRPTPVGSAAAELGLEVIAPVSINQDEPLAALEGADVGALCVAAFGQLLKPPLLARWPCLNVHYSLLPAYRGAAPLERAIMDGCPETGVTIMRMDAGLDTGPMISTSTVAIGPDDDFGTLAPALASAGGALLVAALDDLEAGRLVEVAQPDEGVSLAPKLTDADRVLDFTASAAALARRVRALSPHIGAACEIDDLRIKVWSARPVDDVVEVETLRRDGARLLAGCGEGTLEILELQAPGKARVAADAFLRGWRGPLRLASLAA